MVEVFDPEMGTLDLRQLVRDRVHSEADLQDPVIYERELYSVLRDIHKT